MKKRIIIIVVILALFVAYYAISPLFRNIEVNDALPENMTVPEEFQAEERVADVVGTTGHPASGTVRVLETEDGSIIRYENFETINGPNLHVYLAKDLDAKEFIDLGPIKATRGNINYAVPKEIDIKEYRYVMYWCVPFGVLFNYAELQ